MNDERWLPVPRFEGYEISDLGRVRSVDRTVDGRDGKRYRVKGRLLRLRLNRTGYPAVCLQRGGQKSTQLAHCMVAAAFIGPRPPGMQVAHNDGDRLNSRLDNLRYATPLENADDMVRHGTVLNGRKNHNAKLTETQVLDIIRRAEQGEHEHAIAAAHGIARPTVWHILNGFNWGWLTGRTRRRRSGGVLQMVALDGEVTR